MTLGLTELQNNEFNDIIQHYCRGTHIRFLPNLRGKIVTEFGPNDGNHTVDLARQAKLVRTYDVRPRNLCRAFANCLQNGLMNVEYHLVDLEQIENVLPVDLIYHSGVLYHLFEPIKHLHKLINKAQLYLFDTHVYNEEHEWTRSDECNDEQSIEAYLFEEKSFQDSLIHGISPCSRWFKEDTLLSTMRNMGYKNIDVKQRYVLHENFKRITFTCTC